MCTKWFSDGDVHKYFNPYNTPYEAFHKLHEYTFRLYDQGWMRHSVRVHSLQKVKNKRLKVKSSKLIKVSKIRN